MKFHALDKESENRFQLKTWMRLPYFYLFQNLKDRFSRVKAQNKMNFFLSCPDSWSYMGVLSQYGEIHR